MRFGSILVKLAAIAPKPAITDKLDKHFVATDKSKWKAFKRNLKSKQFAQAIAGDERADEKLKKYTEMMHLHLKGKGEKQTVDGYVIKYHPEHSRFTCSCGDWEYRKSHAGGDCKHIKKLKEESHMEKMAARLPLVFQGFRAKTLIDHSNKAKEETEKARTANEFYDQMFSGLRKTASRVLLGKVASKLKNSI
jgi:hypothetical protein